MSPGFFNIRSKRNGSVAGSIGSESREGFSKTFNNYMRARERVEASLKEKIEKLNKSAVVRVKKERQGEKLIKELAQQKQVKREKAQEKIQATKNRKDMIMKDIQMEAQEAYRNDIKDLQERMKQKKAQADTVSAQ